MLVDGMARKLHEVACSMGLFHNIVFKCIVLTYYDCGQGDRECCKIQRISPQDGPVGSSKYLRAQQRVTSNVQAVTLDVCSDYTHSTRAIVLNLSWTNAVRQGNKFPQ